jgi:hypothetical protein
MSKDDTLHRLCAVEDTLAIYHLIASHSPAADTGKDGYYRDVFVADGVIDLGGGKAANGNEAIAAVVKTPEHQAAIAGGLCHFAGLPRVQLNGVLAGDCPEPRGEAGETFRPWVVERLPHSPARRQPLGSQTHEGRLER